jgi:ribonuclease PH
MIRGDGRRPNELRPVTIVPGYLAHAEGSALIDMGDTRVLCAVTVEDRLPRFALGTGSGWITAEYGMLPRSTLTRTARETSGRSGRTAEIQRLIGRSLRSVTQLDLLGERTFVVDCDVLKADGGTRTASITGAYVALAQAVHTLTESGKLKTFPMRCAVAAISAGILEGVALLDLNYEEDVRAAADFNIVMTEAREFPEVQGTGESHPFTRPEMNELIDLSEHGIRQLFEAQKRALADAGVTTPMPAPAR